jgi:multidrug efflux pump subunit AcrA (membrane-fusion protein)
MLRPGMIAEARIQQDSQVNAITIPASAIIRDADGATQVFAYNPVDKRVYARRITVGTVYGKEVEVITGLTTKEMIVVGGQHRVREGAKVEATTTKATEVAVDSRAKP